jgi:hypothetical protein
LSLSLKDIAAKRISEPSAMIWPYLLRKAVDHLIDSLFATKDKIISKR